MKLALLLALLVLIASVPAQPDDKDARMTWFREARFGMFIHWGLYAIPAGKWGEATGHGEWIRDTAKIPVGEYDKFQPQFNPTKFNADEWAALADEAGMKYVVITTKHHDGFGLFKSKLTDWDVENTPHKKDIMAEVARAYRAKGMRIGWYHSIMDWHHPDYLPRRPWELADRPVGDASFDRYFDYLKGQVGELLTNYGKIDCMWFDGEWESTWNHKYGQALYDHCRKLQPNVIVNNRVDVGRGGMSGFSDSGYAGDYGTPEQEVPDKGIPGVDWESCITTNTHWGFNALDKNYKSGKDLVRLLVDVVSKGGNLLLNVGPRADGTFPPEQVDRLKHIGSWMKTNSESIYGTTASPFGVLSFGRCTQKERTLYFHVFDAPADGKLRLPMLGSKVAKASLLGQSALKFTEGENGIIIDLGNAPLDTDAPVVKLELAEDVKVFDAPTINGISGIDETQPIPFVGAITLKVAPAHKDFEVRYTTGGSEPTLDSTPGNVSMTLGKSTMIKARNVYKGKLVGPTTTVFFSEADPWAALPEPAIADRMIKVSQFDGNFNSCDEIKGPAMRSFTQKEFVLGDLAGKEYVALEMEGWVEVDAYDIYRFSITSDDGSRLYVDGKLVVDNDGLHGPIEKSGLAPLAKGWHKVRVVWFNKTGGAELKVKWERRK